MSFGFGASDFVTLTKIIYKVVSCVQDATGSIPHYQALARAFDSLLPTLDTVSRLNAQTGDQFLRAELQIAVKNTVDHIKRYETSLEKYAKNFSTWQNSAGTASRTKRFYRQIRWKLQIEDTIGTFLNTLSAYNEAINIQLNVLGITTLYAVQSSVTIHGESLLSIQDIFRAHEQIQNERLGGLVGEFRMLFEGFESSQETRDQALGREHRSIREQIGEIYREKELSPPKNAELAELFSSNELDLLLHNPRIATTLLCAIAREHPGVIPTMRARLEEYKMVLPGQSAQFITARLVQFTTYLVTGIKTTLKFRIFSSPQATTRAPQQTQMQYLLFHAPREIVLGDMIVCQHMLENFRMLVGQAISNYLPQSEQLSLMMPWKDLEEWSLGTGDSYQVRRGPEPSGMDDEYLEGYMAYNMKRYQNSNKDEREKSLANFNDGTYQEFSGWSKEEMDFEDENEEEFLPNLHELRQILIRSLKVASTSMFSRRSKKSLEKARRKASSNNTLELRWAIWDAIEQHMERFNTFTNGDMLFLVLHLLLRKAEAMNRPGLYLAAIYCHKITGAMMKVIEWDFGHRVFNLPTIQHNPPPNEIPYVSEENQGITDNFKSMLYYGQIGIFLFAESNPVNNQRMPPDVNAVSDYANGSFVLLFIRLVYMLFVFSQIAPERKRKKRRYSYIYSINRKRYLWW